MASRHDRVLLLALVLSGCAALGDEIMWTRLATLMLGSETMGVLAVLAGFFGGMAIGAAVLHRRAAYGPDPIGLFVRLELATAAFAALAPLVLPWLAERVPAWVGPIAGDNSSPQALAIGIAVAGAALLPGAFCMGATLSAVVEARRRSVMSTRGPEDDDSSGVGRLYAANTFGAVLGVLGTIHFVLPTFGVGWGSLVLASFSALAALFAHRWSARHPASRKPALAEVREPKIDVSRDPDPDVRERLPLLVVVMGAGFVGVGLEVIGVLVLSQLLENTIYTFAHVLSVYLLGTAAGAWLWARFGPPRVVGRPAVATAVLLVALAVSCVLAGWAISNARAILDSIAADDATASVQMFAEACVAAAVFGVPTILMGALFSHVMGLVAPRGIGLAYALNTLGSALAPFVFGVVLVAELGYRDAFFTTVYGYLFVFGAFTWFRRFKPLHQIGAIVAVIALTFRGPDSLVLVEPEDGWTTLVQHETPVGLVSVSEKDASENERSLPGYEPLRRLRLGRHFRMGGNVAIGERRMGHIPLLLQGSAERALFLGIGTGATLSAALAYPLEHVDAVELIPAVVDELGRFGAINLGVTEDPRFSFHKADARRFVTASRDEYDVVVADLFHPGLDGAGGLYALEHFEHVAHRLAPGGAFGQWLPIYQLDEDTLRSVIGTFCDVFPEAHALLGVYNVQTPALLLLGRNAETPEDRLHVDVDALAAKLREPAFEKALMGDARELLAGYLLDRDAMLSFAGDAPRNTDLRPIVTLNAPRVAYENRGTHTITNLRALFDARIPLPDHLLVGDPSTVAAMRADVERFAQALVVFMEAEEALLRSVRTDTTPDAAIAVYLRAHAIAPEFPPPRGRLYDFVRRNARWADWILPVMIEAAPDDKRVWQTWLAHLRRQGDGARLAEAEAEAQLRFGGASSP